MAKVPPNLSRAQRATMASSWLEADTPEGQSLPSWLYVGAAQDDVLARMPFGKGYQSGDREVYTWLFETDRSRIVMTFGPGAEGPVLQAVYVRN